MDIFFLAFAISGYLGWIYDASDNILVPSIVHAIYDAYALVLLRRRFRRDVQPGDAGGT